MDIKTAIEQGIIQSGDVVAYTSPENVLDWWIDFWAGPYYHVGIAFIDENKDFYIYEVKFIGGVSKTKPDATYFPFILVKTGITWDKDMDRLVNSLLGEGYSYINLFLVCLNLNYDRFGYICSTFAGDVLNTAKEDLCLNGLTPTRLVTDLIKKSSMLVTITA